MSMKAQILRHRRGTSGWTISAPSSSACLAVCSDAKALPALLFLPLCAIRLELVLTWLSLALLTYTSRIQGGV